MRSDRRIDRRPPDGGPISACPNPGRRVNAMKLGTRTLTRIAATATVIGISAVAIAQPPGGPGGRPFSEFGGGPPGPPPVDPLREALDRDHDHRLDAEEIKNAATALLALDRNGDGTIDEEEFRPPHPPGGRGPGGPQPGGPAAGRPPEGGPGGGRGPGMGPPSPERFVERALSFDADNDGKLDRDELTKFAEEMGRQYPGPGAGRPPGDGPPGGQDRRGGRRSPEVVPADDAPRPVRPRRPE